MDDRILKFEEYSEMLETIERKVHAITRSADVVDIIRYMNDAIECICRIACSYIRELCGESAYDY